MLIICNGQAVARVLTPLFMISNGGWEMASNYKQIVLIFCVVEC